MSNQPTTDIIEVLMEDEKFVDFLKMDFAMNDGRAILDDELPDKTDDWLNNLSHQQILDLHDQYTEGLKEILEDTTSLEEKLESLS